MPGNAMPTDRLTQWRYKFATSERFKNGVWYAISEDDNPIEPRSMVEMLMTWG